MPEKRIIVLILGIILIAVVLSYFILEILGLEPNQDIFKFGKNTLVRYYVCSLAICTEGCDAGSLTEEICLENNSVTHECDLWCNKLCSNEFGSDCVNKGDCCGTKWNLTVSLGSNVYLKGCDEIQKVGGVFDTQDKTYITEVYDIIKKLFPNLVTENKWGLVFLPIGEDCHRGMIAGDGVEHSPGLIFERNESYTWYEAFKTWEWKIKGTGGIFVDPVESRQEWGCYDRNVPVDWGIISGFLSEDAPGLYQCMFRGDINMWADWQGEDFRGGKCADVYFNSTLTESGEFKIDAWRSAGEECDGVDWCERIKLEETAEYTVKISNYLGSGKKFLLNSIPTPADPDPDCKFYEGTTEINDIFVDNGDFKEFTMECNPPDTLTYNIKITAEPTVGYTAETTDVRLEVVDFELTVFPGSTDVKKNDGFDFILEVKNSLGVGESFDLDYEVKDSGGNDASGKVVCDPFTIDPLPVPDGNGGLGNSQTWCYDSVGVVDNYKITFKATCDGVTKPFTVDFNVKDECDCLCLDPDCKGCVRCSGGFICKNGEKKQDNEDTGDIYCCDDKGTGDCTAYNGATNVGAFCSGSSNVFWTCNHAAQSCTNDKCVWSEDECGKTAEYTQGDCDGHCYNTGCKLCKCGTGPDDLLTPFCDPVGVGCNECIVCDWGGTQYEHVCDAGTDITHVSFGYWDASQGTIKWGGLKACCDGYDCPDWYCYNPTNCELPGTSCWACAMSLEWIGGAWDGIPQEFRCQDSGVNQYSCEIYPYPIPFYTYDTLNDCQIDCKDLWETLSPVG